MKGDKSKAGIKVFRVPLDVDLHQGLNILESSGKWGKSVDEVAGRVYTAWLRNYFFELVRHDISEARAYELGYLSKRSHKRIPTRIVKQYLPVQLWGLQRYVIEHLPMAEPAYPLRLPNPFYQHTSEYALSLILHARVPQHVERLMRSGPRDDLYLD